MLQNQDLSSSSLASQLIIFHVSSPPLIPFQSLILISRHAFPMFSAFYKLSIPLAVKSLNNSFTSPRRRGDGKTTIKQDGSLKRRHGHKFDLLNKGRDKEERVNPLGKKDIL